MNIEAINSYSEIKSVHRYRSDTAEHDRKVNSLLKGHWVIITIVPDGGGEGISYTTIMGKRR